MTDRELLEMIAAQVGTLTKEFVDLKKEVRNNTERLDGVDSRLCKLEVSIEQDIKTDIKALYDGYKQTYEKLETIEAKVDTISEKVDRHDIKIQVIEGGKKKKAK